MGARPGRRKMEKLETDVEIKGPAKKFHEIFCTKVHHIPTMCSDKIPKTEHHEGDLGTEGAVQTWHYVRDGKVETSKSVVVKIDAEKNSVRFKTVEGDLLKEFKGFVSEVQVSPKASGEGSVVHWTLEYEKIHDQIPHPQSLIDLVIGMSKDIDTFLLTN